ncbi:putative phosphoglycerate mutase family protein [Cytidiella melzeri]|nr:putative phosphoglycerate mutase family protein [Cytidiella melzeri]
MSSWFGQDSDQSRAYGQYNARPSLSHQPEVSHELISGAAAYEAAKAYENHVAQNGQPQSHAEAKELLAGFAGAFIDREFESKGLDFIDKEKAKHDAKQQAYNAYDSNN